jgi:hypothetical protein
MPHYSKNKIYTSREELMRHARIEAALGNAVICYRCAATLETYSKKCLAGFNEICPGYTAIESAGLKR